MSDTYRIIHYGIGAIGSEIVRLVAGESSLQVVGAIDVAPGLAGSDVARAVGLDRPLGVTISPDAEALLDSTTAEVVLHCTCSYLEEVQPQLLAAVRAGKNVLSTCEEMAYPWDRHPALSAELDREAKAHGVTVIGTGVNPGFVMDTLVLALTAACQRVSNIQVRRIVDVATRRPQLQAKVGIDLSPKEFRRRAEDGRLGHVGLQESARLIAHGLGWQLDRVEETLEPVVPVETRRSIQEPDEEGPAAGVHHVVRGWMAGQEVLHLDLQMYKDAPEPRDEIIIEGRPPLHLIIGGGIQGDQASPAVVINAIPAVVDAAPGLLTMADLPLVSAFGVPPLEGDQS
jgi:hypothetical protein